MSQIIEVIVGPDGSTTVQTKGFAGASCKDATKFLEKALGETAGEQLTAEFYGTATVQQQNTTQK